MEKMRTPFWKRCAVIALLLVLQVSWLVIVLYHFSYQYTYANYAIRLLAIFVVLHIVNRWINPNNKVSWTFLILLSPIIGMLLYWTLGREGITKATRRKMDGYVRAAMKYAIQDKKAKQILEIQDKTVYRQTKYISDWSGFPIYQNTSTKYYKCGEEMFPAMIEALERAEHFIFLEYFIIEAGMMFDQILEILERKAKAGVDVRLIYDDMGSISKIPDKYYEVIREKGIDCVAFNPLVPVLSIFMNNRDHRKILVVDGKVGFTGGINLADEYINRVERFGYWKDTGICLKGEAVWSLTLMFLSMWDYINDKKEDVMRFHPKSEAFGQGLFKEQQAQKNAEEWEQEESDGFIQPYADSPLDSENVGETVYLNIINQSMEYLYIFTPYLIIGNEMLLALCNAAKRGVDVRIVTPGIPDKKTVFLMTQSYYQPLIQNGVKIYQYRPGFLHAKSFLCDDKIATVGSVNLDYRSLYLNFECGVYLYGCRAVRELKEDCVEVFACSDEITMEFCEKQKKGSQLLQGVLRLLAPLL